MVKFITLAVASSELVITGCRFENSRDLPHCSLATVLLRFNLTIKALRLGQTNFQTFAKVYEIAFNGTT